MFAWVFPSNAWRIRRSGEHNNWQWLVEAYFGPFFIYVTRMKEPA